MATNITLGYWDIRGLAEPIRLLLSYLKVPFTDKKYQTDNKEWADQDKPNLGVSFPNLPYLIDGDLKLTQSGAIPIYLIKKYKRHDLIGQNVDGSYNEREIRVLEMSGVVGDIKTQVIRLIVNPDFKNLRQTYFETNISTLLTRIIQFLGQKEFLLGTLTYSDFLLYDTLILLFQLFPQSKSQVLTDYVKRFESIDGIKQYVAIPHSSDKYFFLKQYVQWAGLE